MRQKQTHFGLYAALVATSGMVALAVISVAAGELRVQAGGLNVSLMTRAEQGFVIKVDGADCPGAGCPAFALNWSMTKNG
tara:strand:+ start:24189 stop:24428 length:240 start_codon:yes stop_codon:yes gene_type:complete